MALSGVDVKLRLSTDADFDELLATINDGAEAYRGVIPADSWKEPYMGADELRGEIEELETPSPVAASDAPATRCADELVALSEPEAPGASGSGGNQHGYMYQAQCIHRCMAAGLTGCPQFTKEESVHVCVIIDEITLVLEVDEGGL